MSEIQLRRKFSMKEQMLQMGFGVTNGKDRLFEMFYLPEESRMRVMKQTFKTGGFGVHLSGTQYCTLWKDGKFHFSEGTSATQSMDVLSYDAIMDLNFDLIREKRFMTKEEYRRCLRYFYSYTADMIHYMNMDTKKMFLAEDEIGLKRITENVHERAFLEKLLLVLPNVQKMDTTSKRDQYRIQEVLDAATFLLHVSDQYIDPDFSYEKPEVFITEDEILQYLCSGSGFESGKYRIWNFCKEDYLLKEISDFIKNEYGNGGHNNALSGDFFSDANYDGKGIRLTKAGCTVQISWMEAAKKIRCLIHADRYLTQSEKEYIPLWERKNLARKIYRFYTLLPASVTKPWKDSGDYWDTIDNICDLENSLLLADLEKQLKLLPEDSENRKEGENLFVELGGEFLEKPEEKFAIPQGPGTQMSIFDFM